MTTRPDETMGVFSYVATKINASNDPACPFAIRVRSSSWVGGAGHLHEAYQDAAHFVLEARTHDGALFARVRFEIAGLDELRHTSALVRLIARHVGDLQDTIHAHKLHDPVQCRAWAVGNAASGVTHPVEVLFP